MKLLITGISGFIGRHLAETLQAQGHEVRGLSRTAGSLPPDVSWVRGDILDRNILAAAVSDVDTVVHLAARAHVFTTTGRNARLEFDEVNTVGVQRVYEAAASARVRRFIFLSSVSAVRSFSDEQLNDGTVPAPSTEYGQSKLAAERRLAELESRHGLPLATLRAPMVYGPRMKGNPLRLFRWIARGLPTPVRGIENHRSIMYVENLVGAILTAIADERAGGTPYFVSDETVSTERLVSLVSASLGTRSLILPAPTGLLRAMGRVGDAVNHVVRFPFNTVDVDRLIGSCWVDASRFDALSGPRHRVPLEDAMLRTAAWFRSQIQH